MDGWNHTDVLALAGVALTALGMVLAGLSALRSNRRHASEALEKRASKEREAIDVEIDELSDRLNTELEKAWNETRRLQVEINGVRDQNGNDLKECVAAFTKTCERLQDSIKVLVPRPEIDDRFDKVDKKREADITRVEGKIDKIYDHIRKRCVGDIWRLVTRV